MLHITCTEKQLPTQLARHQANALLCALRRGRVEERPGTPWRGSAMAPNAPVNLPYSPVVDELRQVARQLAQIEARGSRDGVPGLQDRARYALLLVRREELAREARDAIEKQPEWPYVAGLYAVRVPALRLVVDNEAREEESYTVFRQVTMEDTHPLWPAMSKLLTREPRNTLLPAPAFALEPVGGHRLYKRRAAPPSVAEWLLTQAAELRLGELVEPGDYRGKKEAPPVKEALAAS